MTADPQSPDKWDWLDGIYARGRGEALAFALDVLEPFGPLGAQLIWIAQPALGLFVRGDVLSEIARALEAPGGMARLRQQIEKRGPDAPA